MDQHSFTHSGITSPDIKQLPIIQLGNVPIYNEWPKYFLGYFLKYRNQQDDSIRETAEVTNNT